MARTCLKPVMLLPTFNPRHSLPSNFVCPTLEASAARRRLYHPLHSSTSPLDELNLAPDWFFFSNRCCCCCCCGSINHWALKRTQRTCLLFLITSGSSQTMSNKQTTKCLGLRLCRIEQDLIKTADRQVCMEAPR